MKLIAFSVKNYRSIVEAYKLSLGSYTVLVGPNNEGKSNIVRAIALSLAILTRSRMHRRSIRSPARYYHSEFRDYEWSRDFPISLQKDYPSGRSEFSLEFSLTEDDCQKFRTAVGVNLSTNLKIKLGFGPENVSLDVLMKGRGKKTLNDRREQITEFLRTHVSAEYISALRPSEMALDIVDSLIEGELAQLETNDAYKDVFDQLRRLQQPVLDNIAEKIQATVSEFVPGIRGIQITNDRLAQAFRRSFNIMVDDGANTELAAKGDGIISLTTMSLMKYVSEESLGGKALILSIEEPESHLHPAAIHGLRQVLKDISGRQQVIITTHSPILVEREQIGHNILVRGGRAERARRIDDIREALGIRMSDNLMGADIVLIVEGEEDQDLLYSYLPALSQTLATAMSRKVLIIDHMGGASNLVYKVLFYRQNVYNIHVFLDADDDGRRAIQDALAQNILNASEYNLTSCQDMRNSEIEDLLRLDAYASAIQEKFGVNLNQRSFRSTRAKWSDRVGELFRQNGKLWNPSIKMQVKRIVVDACIQMGVESLNQHRRGPIENLVAALDTKLAARNA